MQYIITPNRFNKFEKVALPVFAVLTFISFIIGIYFALIKSPADYQQGESVRMMYVHVPAAWLSLGIYLGIALSAASYLIWKNPLSGIFMKAEIPIGAVFSLICLITGALWGRPVWGVYWVWDARLTSMLILFFLYVGLYILYNSFEDEEKAARATSVLALIGLVNLPIIRFSVKWWNTLHQPASVMRLDRPAMAPEILTPLMLMFVFFLLLFLTMLILSAKTEILKRKNQRIFLQQTK
jgi:heme exporter protein C